MLPTVSSQRNRRTEPRWQDKVIAGFWLPFSLLFHVWVFFTPSYEEKWGLLQSSQSLPHPRHSAYHTLLIATLAVISALGFALFVLSTLPPLASRLLLVMTFGFSFWQFMRPKA